jgi:hypothetical protein
MPSTPPPDPRRTLHLNALFADLTRYGLAKKLGWMALKLLIWAQPAHKMEGPEIYKSRTVSKMAGFWPQSICFNCQTPFNPNFFQLPSNDDNLLR